MYAPQYRSRRKSRFYAQSYIHIVEPAGPLPGVELHARASAFANRYRDSHASRHRHAFVYPTANLPACRRRNTDSLIHASGNLFAHRRRDYCTHTGTPGNTNIYRRACAFSRAR